MKQLTIAIFFLTSLCFSQSELSIYGGSSLMGSSVKDSERIIGYSLVLNIQVNDKVAIGAGYGERGYKLENKNSRLQGIDIFASINLLDANNFSLWAGPKFGYLYNADWLGAWEDAGINDVSNNFERETDIGISIGANLRNSEFSYIRLEYYHSLNNHFVNGMNNIAVSYGRIF